MKQAFILFTSLLVMLIMISVFGGSLRLDAAKPALLANPPFPYEAYIDAAGLGGTDDAERSHSKADDASAVDGALQAPASPAPAAEPDVADLAPNAGDGGVEAFTPGALASF